MITKRIDAEKLRAQIVLAYATLGPVFFSWLVDQEEVDEGVLIDVLKVVDGLYDIADTSLIPYINKYMRENSNVPVEPIDTGTIDPDPLEPPDPEPDPDEPDPDLAKTREVRIMNTGKKMSWNQYPYDKFVFPKLGPEYTKEPFDIVFEDGNKLHIPNPEKMYMTPDNMKYQPGGQYSNNNPDIPTMEVYARRDTHPKWVEARFRHPVDNTPTEPVEPKPDEPSLPPGVRKFRVDYGDNKNLGMHGHDGRSRTWWTDLHGRSAGEAHKWTQKYPLPKWVDDKPYRLDVKASDGQRFSIIHTGKETVMLSGNGPKYRRQTENTPGKDHPKLGMKYGTKTDWIEVVATPM